MINTNTPEYVIFYNWVAREHGPMAEASIPQPNTGIREDLDWVDESDYTMGLKGHGTTMTDDQMESAQANSASGPQKKFLWMPMKWGIPVAIIGAAAIGYGIYRLVKHYKKAA